MPTTTRPTNPQTFFQQPRRGLAVAAQNTLNRAQTANVNLNEINRLARELKTIVEGAIAAGEENNNTGATTTAQRK
jgi:hypothetical protein